MKKVGLLIFAAGASGTVFADSASDLATGETVFSFVGMLICIVIGAYITRAIFSIPKIIRLLRGQATLLALMAKKAGIEEEKVDKTMNYIDGKN